MLKLIRYGSNDFEMRIGGMSLGRQPSVRFMRGTRTETVIRLEAYGVNSREIANALVSLETNKHHYADFGINRTFMYSGLFNN